MAKVLKLLLLAAALLAVAAPSVAAERATGHLVGVAWLQKHLADPNVVILDASPAKLHGAQHIPGAINVDLFGYGPQEMPNAEMERRFQSWGVSPGKRIVIYDEGGSYMATRIFFDLLYRGFPVKNLLILDGGIAKWRAEGGAVTKEPTPAPRKGTFRVTRTVEDIRVRLPEFLNATGDPKNNALIEALDASWHFGEAAFFDRAGHVPHGIMLPATDFFNPDKTFKSAGEIQRMLTYLGVSPAQPVYTYCGGGLAAAVPFFALKFILNYPKVKLYQESQLEWLQDDRGLPFWTYDAPFLMRHTPWLKTWGGRMMRMYGVSKVSIVDVRSAEDYKQGHLPFALNVPAEVLETGLGDPGRLAQLLGEAGVDDAHEAVVVSDGGLDPRSALAFLALESLGQKRTSIFMHTIDKWAELGQTVVREPTAVGPRKAPGDLSIPVTAYAAKARGGMLVADPRSTSGHYPKIYVASGKDLPGRAVDGTVVHVPYTALLESDGTPKPAKDIWKLLAKAGVSRYAEIICFSDQPGEAAANYFLLKLMGFPDVKVWVP